jgi:hypothetical protein
MRQLGFDFTVLLGAAGIVTVAIGFASQTSASNLISGLFLVWRRRSGIGDIVTVDGVTGEVLSVDLLSTKLRTFDNLQVRIPNETMVKARITTLNRFPLRRVDLTSASLRVRPRAGAEDAAGGGAAQPAGASTSRAAGDQTRASATRRSTTCSPCGASRRTS